MKLDADWIIETHTETCLACHESKSGKFLIISLSAIGVRRYFALCEQCTKLEKAKA